jgi:hypothetical protein
MNIACVYVAFINEKLLTTHKIHNVNMLQRKTFVQLVLSAASKPVPSKYVYTSGVQHEVPFRKAPTFNKTTQETFALQIQRNANYAD